MVAPFTAFALAVSAAILTLIVIADWFATIPVDPPWADEPDDPDLP